MQLALQGVRRGKNVNPRPKPRPLKDQEPARPRLKLAVATSSVEAETRSETQAGPAGGDQRRTTQFPSSSDPELQLRASTAAAKGATLCPRVATVARPPSSCEAMSDAAIASTLLAPIVPEVPVPHSGIATVAGRP
ncbi:hypothetical protein HPB47_014993 [Ixodes persulcatus]|uniref:Uncharacterized protein n=1 Tax=Ixodes persulcatus TaxID=34615 RepID=A0AC60QX49_IXOPE|nr:hypothetical protein HPB47_014993 [Ixodes persulcatus]